TLTRGFKVVIHEERWSGKHLSGRNMEQYSIPAQIGRHGVTHFQCTPSQASMLLQDEQALGALRKLKKLLVGGEALPAALARQLAGCAELYNMYGPTEATIWSTAARLEPNGPVTIGRPLANTYVYIVNEELQPVAGGEVGELLIGGKG